MYHTRKVDKVRLGYKEKQRCVVLDFILQHHTSPVIHYLGLPSVEWSVERRLLKKHRVGFVYCDGIEILPKVAIASVTAMSAAVKKNVSGGNESYYSWPRYSIGDYCKLHVTACSTYLANPDYLYPDRHTAVWLDLTSNFGEEMIACCRALPRRLVSYLDVPVAFSFMIGREHPVYKKHLELLGGKNITAAEQRCNATLVMLRAAATGPHGETRPVELIGSAKYNIRNGPTYVTMFLLFRRIQ